MNDYNHYDDEKADMIFDLFLKAMIFLVGSFAFIAGLKLIVNNWESILEYFTK